MRNREGVTSAETPPPIRAGATPDKNSWIVHTTMALLGVGFFGVIGGLTWATCGGGPLTGSTGGVTALVGWPVLGLLVFLAWAGVERISDIKVRSPLRGVETLGELCLAALTFILSALFLLLLSIVVIRAVWPAN